MYRAVCSPGRIPGTKAPLFFKLSAVSLLLNTKAVWKKQKNTIAMAYNSAWMGSPGPIDAAKSFKNRTVGLAVLAPAVNQPTIVAGNKIIDEANIGGITPAIFNFNGRCDVCPP